MFHDLLLNITPSKPSSQRERATSTLFKPVVQSRAFWALLFTAAVATQASAQQYIYPAKGQSTQPQQSAFNKARAACLEGRGYTVK